MLKVISCAVIVGLLALACGGGAGNPEDVVKGFFEAIKGGDIDKAMAYLPEGEEVDEDAREQFEMAAGFMEMMEIEVTGSEIDGDDAIVFVKMTFMGEETEEEIELQLIDGKWKLEPGF